MKFLILAFIVGVASAAVQPLRPFNTAAQAFASVTSPARNVVTAPARSAVAAPVRNVVTAPARAVAQAAVSTYNAGQSVEATVLRQDSEVNPDGFNYAYETSNGISASSSGTLRHVDNADVLAVQGQYQYTLDDGTPFQLSYVADENGYQPQSAFLPVAPPVPAAIQRSLEYIAAHYREPTTRV